MRYKNIIKGKFLSRPNRFIAHVEVEGKRETCHVKNTGRCRELLIPGADVFIQSVENFKRKTKYDLIGVYKGKRLINIDSQAPNKVFHEWLLGNNPIFKNISIIKSEYQYQSSRLDFYIENGSAKIIAEVKGVTLEKGGIALFPDAPTERGLKHIYDLCHGVDQGFEACLFFIIQMKGVRYFTHNTETHQAFGDALIKAKKLGVKIAALDCEVDADYIIARDFVEVRL